MTDQDKIIAKGHAEKLRQLAAELRIDAAGFSVSHLKTASSSAADALDDLADIFDAVDRQAG